MTKIPDIQAMTDSEKLAVLMQRMQALEAQNDALAKQSAEYAADIAAANKKIADLQDQLEAERAEKAFLIEQVRINSMRYYGCKSEHVVADQMPLFNDSEAESNTSVFEPEVDDVLPKKKHKRGGKRVLDYDRFETVIVEHEIPQNERACPECGCEMSEMSVEVTKRVRMVPAHLVVEEHHRHVYKCCECCDSNAKGSENKAVIVRASQPKPPIPGSFVTASFLSWIVNAKYSNSMPLFRIQADLKTIGVDISRQNMANWIVNIHTRWLAKVHARMKVKLLSCDLLHADETKIQVLKEPDRKATALSYMWLFCTSKYEKPIYIYEYHPTRAKSVPQDFLRGWSGTLTTDGYAPYYNLANKGITNTSCLVHIRRKFVEVIKSAGSDDAAAKAGSIALEARKRIDAMFHADGKLDDMDAKSRKIARLEVLAPMMNDFSIWLDEQLCKASPGLSLDKALRYAKSMWPYMINVLNDGRLVLDNNIAERAIKPFVIGRKNWLFSNTPKGAEASAAIYSIVTTAKMNGLNPRLYVEWLLEEMPNVGELTDEVVDGFLPWAENVPERLKMSPKAFEKASRMDDDPITDVNPDLLEDD